MILDLSPVLKRLALVTPTMVKVFKGWQYSVPIDEILVAEIDPKYCGGKDLCQDYDIPESAGVNCIIVNATRGKNSQLAVCLYPVGSRVELNKTVRRFLNARNVSLAPLEQVLEKTQMEYGSITVLGLPQDWPILIEQRILLNERIILGAGKVNAKLSIPTKLLTELPNSYFIQDMVSEE